MDPRAPETIDIASAAWCGTPPSPSSRQLAFGCPARGVQAPARHESQHVARPQHSARPDAQAFIPDLAVLDIDDPASGGPTLSLREEALLAELLNYNTPLVLATAYEAERLVGAVSDPRLRAALELAPIISLDPAGPPLADSGAAMLAQTCSRLGGRLDSILVVAATPLDAPLALEADTTWALRGSGPTCEAVARQTFPPRDQGGLTQALRHLTERLQML